MPSYSLVRPFTHDPTLPEEPPTYAVVASDTEAHYVFRGPGFLGLNDARIARLVKASGKTPTTEQEWMKIALRNIGYFWGDKPVPCGTLAEAILQAKEALSRK